MWRVEGIQPWDGDGSPYYVIVNERGDRYAGEFDAAAGEYKAYDNEFYAEDVADRLNEEEEE